MKGIQLGASYSETYTGYMSFVAVVVYILKTIYNLQDKNY